MNMLSDNYEAWQQGVEVLHHPTQVIDAEKAIGLPKRGTKDDVEFLPKSQVCACETGGIVRIYIMPWLYQKLVRS